MANQEATLTHKLLFTEARTAYAWQNKPVEDALLQEAYDLAKMGPTSVNCSPMRIIFIKSPEAKEHLKPALSEGNIEKTMTAPVVALIANDMEFYTHLEKLFPHSPDVRSWFEGNEKNIQETVLRNGSLQGAYFMLAARSLGLDCGPMSGFDAQRINEIFFKDTPYKINFLCNLGYGETSQLHPRLPRFSFEEACRII